MRGALTFRLRPRENVVACYCLEGPSKQNPSYGVEDNHRMSFTVFLGNLPVWVTADDIKGWLTAENLVADSIKVIRNPETQESKGFAFIDAPNTEEMNAIIRRFDRAPLEDRLLRANPAQPPRPKSQTEGRGRPMSPPGYGGGSHQSGHASMSGYSSGQSAAIRQGSVSAPASAQHGSPAGPAASSGQPSTSTQGLTQEGSGAGSSAAPSGPASSSSSSAASPAGGDLRPPPRRRGKSSVKRSTAGGSQSPFAEELAKAL
jgi:hypothetical protein